MHMCKVNLIKKKQKECRIVFYLDSQRTQKHGLQPMGIIWLQFHIPNPLKSEMNLHYI